jgi:hypothetical protein
MRSEFLPNRMNCITSTCREGCGGSSEYGVYSVSGSGAVDKWLVYGSSDGYLLSPTSYRVIMMDRSDGRLLLLRRWEDGSRCAWISACVT